MGGTTVRRGRGQNDSAHGRRTAIICAAALTAALVGLGYGGTMRNVPATHAVLAVAPAQAASAPGADLYGQRCAMCHQANGKGMSGAFPPLADSSVVNGDPHYLARVVLYGLQGRIVVNGQTYSSSMAGLAGSMNDAQIAQVLTYIRSSWGNSAPAVNDDVVKEERAVPGTAQDNGAKYPK